MTEAVVAALLKDYVTRISTKTDDVIGDLLGASSPLGIGDVVKYDHLRQRWHYWDGIIWRPDLTKHVPDMVRQKAVEWIGANVLSGEDEKAVISLLNMARKKAVLESLSMREGIALSGNEWDPHPWHLGFNNGVLDLRDSTFHVKPDPEWRVSRTVGFDYDPSAECPNFWSFMASIFPQNGDVLEYVIRLLAYSLFGLQSEQKFWVWVGRGSNGKGILARTMEKVLGDYVETPAYTLYMKTRSGETNSAAARPDLIRLQGARFTYMSEPPGNKFNEELLKAHTGEDVIIARDLYGKSDAFAKFTATHTIIFLTNDPPRTDDVGVSMRRRARIVRFNEDFSGDRDCSTCGTRHRPDQRIEEKVKAERAGIMNVLVGAAKEWWDERSIPEPVIVTQWSTDYIEENDPLMAWIEEDCVLTTGARTGSAVLYGDYQDWCSRKGIEAKSHIWFSSKLVGQFTKSRVTSGVQFEGIALKGIEYRVGDGDDDD